MPLAFENPRLTRDNPTVDVQAEADIKKKDSIGYTPLMYATIELAERMGNGGNFDDAEAGVPQSSPESETPEAPARSCAIS